MNRIEFRSSVLFTHGASLDAARELLDYNANPLEREQLTLPKELPLASEAHVETWERYTAQARQLGACATLAARLVQYQFPIRKGISQTAAYRAATRNGASTADVAEATGLSLKCPESIRLGLHQSLAGSIPILITGEREDFVTLVQALARRNEPDPIPDSMGACIVTGYNNWDRIRELRRRWEADNPTDHSESTWAVELLWNIVPHTQLYQDTFIILSDGPYSHVPAHEMGLSEDEWRRMSLSIRLEHECTHYLTRRVFASMRNNMLDELIADYRGIVATLGRYQASWFLRFVGLEAFPAYRDGGRLGNYRGQPPLSDEAFGILQAIVKDAAENLEQFDREHAAELETPEAQTRLLLALSLLTLEELSAPEAASFIQQTLNTF